MVSLDLGVELSTSMRDAIGGGHGQHPKAPLHSGALGSTGVLAGTKLPKLRSVARFGIFTTCPGPPQRPPPRTATRCGAVRGASAAGGPSSGWRWRPAGVHARAALPPSRPRRRLDPPAQSHPKTGPSAPEGHLRQPAEHDFPVRARNPRLSTTGCSLEHDFPVRARNPRLSTTDCSLERVPRRTTLERRLDTRWEA